jgi:hypothetical protein
VAIAWIGIVVIFGGLFYVGRYRHRHNEAEAASAMWRRTDEVFVDPATGRHMRVWLDERNERKYVPERGQ